MSFVSLNPLFFRHEKNVFKRACLAEASQLAQPWEKKKSERAGARIAERTFFGEKKAEKSFGKKGKNVGNDGRSGPAVVELSLSLFLSLKRERGGEKPG